jgi:hypothetical protein
MFTGMLKCQSTIDWNDSSYFAKVAERTNKITPEILCTKAASKMLPYAQICFDLEFSDKPPYEKLKHLLIKILLKEDKIPGVIFDWSKFRVPKVKNSIKKSR